MGAIAGLARRLRASDGIVGLLTAGGEWEELIVVLFAIIGGHPGLAVGNVIGSCLANLIGSMPLGLFGGRPLTPDRSARVYGALMVVVTILTVGLAAGGRVTPLAGGVLLVVFFGYVVSVLLVIWRGWLRPPEAETPDETSAESGRSLGALIGMLVVSLAVICGAAEAIVLGAVHVARTVGLSEYAIGATVVAIGTTLPDKAISLVGGRTGESGVVTANVLGSNIFLLTLVLGVAALANGSDLAVDRTVREVDLPLLLGTSVIVVLLFRRASLHWRTGLVLLGAYVAYLVFAFIRG